MSSQQLLHMAIEHHRNGAFPQAEPLYQRFIASQPRHADALHLLGLLYHQTGRAPEAIKTITDALHIQPGNPDYLNNLGLALSANGQQEEAIQAYQRGLQAAPRDTDLQTNIANTLAALSRYEEAAGYYRRVLHANPYDQEMRLALVDALRHYGNQCHHAGKFQAAEACFQETIQLVTQEASLYYNLGNAQRALGKLSEAEANYRNALRLQPRDADAHNNLGNVLREQGKLTEAIAQYEMALSINPALFHAKVHLVHQKQHICDWEGLEHGVQEIRQWLRDAPEAQISPFAFLAMPHTTPDEQLTCANHWLNNRYGALHVKQQTHAFLHKKHLKSRLRIGYLSGDFRLHPLAALITDTIELHHRDQIECFAYSYARDDNTPERKRLALAFDHFIDISSMSLEEAAQRIHADGIDILVDLTGFTQSSRTGIVALKPAPISVSWLGFPGTMGKFSDAPLFDYLLTDGYITPASAQPSYAEQLKPLQCYQPNDRKRPIAKAPLRADYGLPEDAFVFCCFNQTFKILPDTFTVWMNILKAVPDSVLWLLECNPQAKTNLQKAAELRGVNASRLYFAPRIPMAGHLARHDLADLFLDTAPYNAHTTASDALWMCLPLLTYAGETFASRVAGSLLHAVNLPELVTTSLKDYESLAIELAGNPQRMEALRNQLRQSSDQLILFNTPAFVQALEQAYHEMWQAYIRRS
jgi:predicted O-linked N-acetylglucosamine transferase (SPINDLY family)